MINSMINQKVFDKVAKHLLTQGVPATRLTAAGPECAYRGDEGRACAMGCLISDEEYDPTMEGGDVYTLVKKFGVLKDYNIDLLSSLQDIHDADKPCDWPDWLRSTAADFGLNAEIVDTRCE